MIYACPTCRAPMQALPDALVCGCSPQLTIPVVGGIPRFLADPADAGFDQRWAQHPKPQADTERWFWEKTGWTAADCAGKTILDAGCGCGRFAVIAARHGAHVVGVDGSGHAVEAAAVNVPGGEFVQADLMRLPLPDACMDAAFSIGVLHHAPDPARAFAEAARTVKPSGKLAVWVYAQPVPDALLPASRFLHEITRTCPPEVLHAACEQWALPLRAMYDAHPEYAVLRSILQVSGSRDDEECISDTFDWHTPQYRFWHTVPEVRGWFEATGCDVTWVGGFPVSVGGIKRQHA